MKNYWNESCTAHMKDNYIVMYKQLHMNHKIKFGLHITHLPVII